MKGLWNSRLNFTCKTFACSLPALALSEKEVGFCQIKTSSVEIPMTKQPAKQTKPTATRESLKIIRKTDGRQSAPINGPAHSQTFHKRDYSIYISRRVETALDSIRSGFEWFVRSHCCVHFRLQLLCHYWRHLQQRRAM